MGPLSFRPRNCTFYQSAARQSPWRSAANPMAVVAEMRSIVHMAGEDGGSSIKGRVSLAARRLVAEIGVIDAQLNALGSQRDLFTK